VNGQRQEALLKEYGEVSNLFRIPTDIQFRLLGILPIASAVTAALGARTQSGGEVGVPIALAQLGLASSVGVVTYNARNDEKEGSGDLDEVVYGLAGTLTTTVDGQHEITAGHSVFVPRVTVPISTRTFI
jgi:hypothetical protein